MSNNLFVFFSYFNMFVYIYKEISNNYFEISVTKFLIIYNQF